MTERLRKTLADLDNKMRMKNEGKTWKEMGFKDEGEMKIVFSQFKNRAGKPRQYLQYPLVDNGIYLVDGSNATKTVGTNMTADIRGSYRLRVHGGIVGDPPSIRRFLRVSDRIGDIGALKVKGTAEAPQTVEITNRARIDEKQVSFRVEENRADIRVLDQYLRRLDPGGQWASIWIDWIEVEGPFYEKGRSFFEALHHPKPTRPGQGESQPVEGR